MKSDPDVHAEGKSKGWHPEHWVSLIPYGIHETHPAERGRSREAGASPVWSDPDLVPTCRFCGAPIGRDRDGRWAATHPGDDAPWSCPVNAGGHAPFEREADR